MNAPELIYFGKVGVENTSGLRNPLVKLMLLTAPLAVVFYQQVGRLIGWPRLSLRATAIVAAFLYLANILDFSDRERPRMIRRAVAGVVFFGGIYCVATHPTGQLAAILGVFSKVYSWIPIFRDFLPESWLYLVFSYIAILAVRGFNTREALWLGRRLLWKLAFVVYAVVVITFAVINSALPLRLSVSWRVARDKAALMRNPYLQEHLSWFGRLQKSTAIFALTLIGNNSSVAQSVDLLSQQRGFFRFGYRDVIGGLLSNEDVTALILVGLLLFILIIGWV